MKYIIVGAVAGGASTAARLRRMDEHAEIVIFEKGEFISYANCGLPYYIGDVIKDRNKLFVQTAASFRQRFNINVKVQSEVLSIDRQAKKITAKNLLDGTVYEEYYDKLVLSPGAEPVRPPLPGIDIEGIFTLRNVADTDRIKAWADVRRTGHAVVIGGGFIGLEMAENLHQLGISVTIMEMGKQILAPLDFPIAALVQQHIRSKGVDLRLHTAVSGFERRNNRIVVNLNTGAQVETDLVMLSIGVKPDTKLARESGLQTGEARGIVVNEFLQTSDPDIYAVGDAIEFANPLTGKSMNTYLAGPANKQGRICADNIVTGNTVSYKGAINTAIVKVFDLTVGSTGLAAKHLDSAGIEYRLSTTHSGSHAGYYPDSFQMSIQIAFRPETGVLLGAQVAGYEGADKRLDILALAVKNRLTIDDLAEFEHAYAPPFSSAKDPINMAGFVAGNIRAGRLKVVYWNKTSELSADDLLLDVRTPKEFSTETIPGAVNIPVDDLRSRLAELPKDKDIYIFCQIGLRGYLAQRILLQKGYDRVRNISGGFFLWKACTEESGLS